MPVIMMFSNILNILMVNRIIIIVYTLTFVVEMHQDKALSVPWTVPRVTQNGNLLPSAENMAKR